MSSATFEFHVFTDGTSRKTIQDKPGSSSNQFNLLEDETAHTDTHAHVNKKEKEKENKRAERATLQSLWLSSNRQKYQTFIF